jgi:hypothetical protein
VDKPPWVGVRQLGTSVVQALVRSTFSSAISSQPPLLMRVYALGLEHERPAFVLKGGIPITTSCC